jgi:hypothetical protein
MRVADTPRRYAWFAPDVTAPIFSWVGAAASLLSNGHPSDVGQARPASHTGIHFLCLQHTVTTAQAPLLGKRLSSACALPCTTINMEVLLLKGKQ